MTIILWQWKHFLWTTDDCFMLLYRIQCKHAFNTFLEILKRWLQILSKLTKKCTTCIVYSWINVFSLLHTKWYCQQFQTHINVSFVDVKLYVQHIEKRMGWTIWKMTQNQTQHFCLSHWISTDLCDHTATMFIQWFMHQLCYTKIRKASRFSRSSESYASEYIFSRYYMRSDVTDVCSCLNITGVIPVSK